MGDAVMFATNDSWGTGEIRPLLRVGRNWSRCENCGKGAYPGQQTHDDVAGWKPRPGEGCGIRWTKVTSDYAGELAEAATRRLRPDLEFV